MENDEKTTSYSPIAAKNHTSTCFFTFICDINDSDSYINKKYENFQQEAKENPSVPLTFINRKTRKIFIASGGKINEVGYKGEDGTVSYVQIIEAIRENYNAKDERQVLNNLNSHFQGDATWDAEYKKGIKRIDKQIKRDELRHLPLHGYEIPQGASLLELLRTNKFVSPKTQKDNFLYIMGFTDIQPDEPEEIHWLASNPHCSCIKIQS